MISETIGGGTYRGQIKSVSDREIEFVLLIPGRTHHSLYYMRNEGRVDFQDGSSRSVTAENCVPAPLHDIINQWESWGPLPLEK